MNPVVTTILTRVVAGLAVSGAAAVPTISSGEPTAIPATMEEAIVQVLLALIAVGVVYLKKKVSK